MPILTPLDPVQSHHLGGYDFIALAAGRTDRGLDVSVQVSNGVVCWAGIVTLADEPARRAASIQIAEFVTLSADKANFALLQLIPKVEDKQRAYGAPDDWPDPIPLSGSAPPAFPVACLPSWLRDMVTGTAESLQVPVDLPAMLSLAVLGTALAKKVDVRVRQGYYIPLNAYVVAGMESGERKSPTYRAMLKPLVDHEHERIAAVKEENLRRTAAKEEPLPLPQLFADDITTEQVPVKLEENGERLAIFSDEGDSLDIMAGRYSKGTPNFGIYLKGWDGGAYKVNRGMRPSIYLSHPLLSIGLCVQPSVLRGLAETPAFRDRGLLGRFWFTLPTSYMGWRKPVGTPVADKVRDAYAAHVRSLLALPLFDKPASIGLSHEAHTLLVRFNAEIEPLLRPEGELRTIKDWVAKLEGSVVRLSGMLHMAHGYRDSEPISAQIMEQAITIGRYLLVHAQCTFGLMRSNPFMQKAEVLLRWIQRRGVAEFSRREVYRGNPTHFDQADECMPALAILVERYYISQRPPPRRGEGRPATPVYDVNPKILCQNCQNSPVPEETGISGPLTEYRQNAETIDTTPNSHADTAYSFNNPGPDLPPPIDPAVDGWMAGSSEGFWSDDV